jgi:hypothetical protein
VTADSGGRYGVIVGMSETVTNEEGAEVIDRLAARFPGVIFAIVTGAASVAFPLPPDNGSEP